MSAARVAVRWALMAPLVFFMLIALVGIYPLMWLIAFADNAERPTVEAWQCVWEPMSWFVTFLLTGRDAM